MAYYMLLYYGENLTGQLASWNNFTREIGRAVIEGDPLVSEGEGSATAYAIVKAASADEARELSKGAPPLQSGGHVDIYKMVDTRV